MSFFKQYRTPFGYVADGNQVDAYGIDHSGFSTRDEVEYQFERFEKEKQMAENLKQQGIEPENYPQLGNSFWGNNPENNYGFGNSNISANVENRQNQYTNSSLFPKYMANDDMVYKVAQNNLSNVGPNVGINTSNKIDYSLYGDGFSKEFIDQMINDKEFNQILNEYIIPNEGGLSDKPNDRGKLTKYGISKNTYPYEDIKNLTRERANAIIYRDFYKWNGLNKLPYPIRGFVVDYGMPSSTLNAIKTVHKVLGLTSNGNIIEPATMGKIKNFSQADYEKFLESYKQSMKEHYNNIVNKDPSQEGNLTGWLNRANRAHLAK